MVNIQSREQLVELVLNEITMSGSIQISIPDKEIERIISDAERFFYKEYRKAAEPVWFVITKEEIDSKMDSKRRIKLPSCILSVASLQEAKVNSVGNMFNINLSNDILIAAQLFLSSYSSDDLVLRAAQYVYYDLAKSFILDRIQYDYNHNTNNLTILGRNPRYALVMKAYVAIKLIELYNDYLFIEYVKGKAYISMANVYTFMQFPLPGGVVINASELKNQGKEMVDKVIETIKSQEVPDFFIIN